MKNRLFCSRLLLLAFLFLQHNVLFATNDPIPASLHWQKLNLEEQVELKINRLLKMSAPDLEVLVKVLISAKPDAENTTKSKKQKFINSLNVESDATNDPANTDIVLRKLDVTKDDFLNSEIESEMTFPDLLEDINDIDVYLYFKKTTPKPVRDQIAKLVSEVFDKKFNRNLNLITADVPFEYVPNKVVVEESLLDKFSPLFVPAAIILGVIFLSLSIIFFVKKLRPMISEIAGSISSSKNESSSNDGIGMEQESDKDDFGNKIQGLNGSPFQEISFQKFPGLKRFKYLMDNDINEARHIFRKWVVSKVEIENKVIGLLTRSLEDDEIIKLTKPFPIEINNRIKELITSPMNSSDFPVIDQLVDQTIMSSLLDLRPHLPLAVREIIGFFSPDKVSKVCIESPMVGSVLFHYCEKDIVSAAIPLIPMEVLESCLKYSNELSNDFLQEHMSEIQSITLKAAEDIVFEKSLAIMNIFPTIFDSVSIGNEKDLLVRFSAQMNFHDFRELVLNKLPVHFLTEKFEFLGKYVFSSYSISDKAELLYSVPEQISWKMIDWVGADGSKAREVLEVELNDLKSKSQSTDDKAWNKFFQKMRSVLKSNYEFSTLAEKEVDGWINQHYQFNDQSKTGKLSLVS